MRKQESRKLVTAPSAPKSLMLWWPFGKVRLALPLVVAVLLLPGCEENPPKASAEEGRQPPARFQAVTVKKGVSDKEIEGFCDARGLGKLKLPELQESSPKLTGATWVNVWATWCKSCVEEMPMIAGWEEKLGAKLIFISADEDPEALPKFQATHRQFPSTLRMKTPEGLPDWLTQNRIDPGSGLPLHLFVSDKGDILCARTGAIAEHHFRVVSALLAETPRGKFRVH